jgi:BASS family bile acid:Na+ symporter
MLTPLETSLIALMLVVLMFGMGTTLTWARFREVAQHPKAFVIGTASQFGWMPLIAFLLATTLELPREAALGLIVMSACPGGTTSNLFAHLARADVALSIAMTATSKLLGIVMMPLCLFLYASRFTDAKLAMPYGDVVKTLVVLLLPVALGMAARRRFGERFAARAEKLGSASGLVLLVALVAISVVRNRAGFVTIPPVMYAAALSLGAAGMALGALLASVAGLSRAQRRTVAFETGVQNSPLCFAILIMAFPGELQQEILKLPLLYALFILLEASLVTVTCRLLDARSATQAIAGGEASPGVGLGS